MKTMKTLSEVLCMVNSKRVPKRVLLDYTQNIFEHIEALGENSSAKGTTQHPSPPPPPPPKMQLKAFTDVIGVCYFTIF